MQKIITAIPDAMVVAGCCLVAFGAWLLLPAAGFIAGGLLAIGLGIMAALKAGK